MRFFNLKTFYLKSYRFAGFCVLSSALLWLFGYGFVILFFLFNNSWVAPTVISPTSDRMLQFTAGYQTAKQNELTVEVTDKQAQRDFDVAVENLDQLEWAKKRFMESAPALVRLQGQKRGDVAASITMDKVLQKSADDTLSDLKNGLITRQEASAQAAGVQTFHNQTTDGAITYHSNWNTLDTAATALHNQYITAKADVLTKRDLVKASDEALQLARHSVQILEDSSYFHALGNGSNMVFVSYDNHSAKVGAPIYDCYMLIIACHKVGTVTHLYTDEQLVEFPLFNIKLSRTVRGVMADTDVNTKSMHSTVLFVGHKPLLF